MILLLSKANTVFLLLLRVSASAPAIPKSSPGTWSEACSQPLRPHWDSSAIVCSEILSSCY